MKFKFMHSPSTRSQYLHGICSFHCKYSNISHGKHIIIILHYADPQTYCRIMKILLLLNCCKQIVYNLNLIPIYVLYPLMFRIRRCRMCLIARPKHVIPKNLKVKKYVKRSVVCIYFGLVPGV